MGKVLRKGKLKKAAQKGSSIPSKPQSQEKQHHYEADSLPENEGFNFGGLPSRDLKKNLGCG